MTQSVIIDAYQSDLVHFKLFSEDLDWKVKSQVAVGHTPAQVDNDCRQRLERTWFGRLGMSRPRTQRGVSVSGRSEIGDAWGVGQRRRELGLRSGVETC